MTSKEKILKEKIISEIKYLMFKEQDADKNSCSLEHSMIQARHDAYRKILKILNSNDGIFVV